MARQLQYDDRLDAEHPPTAVDFHDTEFFRQHPDAELPSPQAIRSLHNGLHVGISTFRELGLFVKFGLDRHVCIEEAQSMQAIRRAFSRDEIPVPELVAWRREEDINFIYMSFVEGVTLQDVWTSLTLHEKDSITNQLGRIVGLLRSLEQEEGCGFIGSISQTRLPDVVFRCEDNAGPFFTSKDFNDALKDWGMYKMSRLIRDADPFRKLLSDASRFHFSHADLHLGNLLISGESGSRSIAAVVDWGQSGWYPEYWEYCKMLMLSSGQEFEREDWFMRAFKVYGGEWKAFSEYWRMCGGP